MAVLLAGLPALLGGAGAAAGTGATVAATAGSGISLASILQGTATVLGLVATVGAGLAEADQLEAEAIDAESEQSQEVLQGISRRTSIKQAMMDAVGAQDVAYAASGVDLSFGTARQARSDAYREADLALTTSSGTEMSRISRLAERAKNYRSAAKRAKTLGFLKAGAQGIGGFLELKEAF